MTDKSAHTQVPIHELLATRWSPRAFADKAVEPEKLLALLEAARWAASCFNEQPWSYFVAHREDKAAYEQLFSCLVPGNQSWVKAAPVLLLSVAKTHFAYNDQLNRHAGHDVGLATANLTIEATALGLSVHQMAGFDAAKARERLQIPDDYEPMAMIAIGYRGAPDVLPEALQEKELAPRTRKPLKEFVFTAQWGHSADLVKK